jgi:hypothetical protein
MGTWIQLETKEIGWRTVQISMTWVRGKVHVRLAPPAFDPLRFSMEMIDKGSMPGMGVPEFEAAMKVLWEVKEALNDMHIIVQHHQAGELEALKKRFSPLAGHLTALNKSSKAAPILLAL